MTCLLYLALLDNKLRLDLSPGSKRIYEISRDYKGVDNDDQSGFVDKVEYQVDKGKLENGASLTVSYTLLKRSMDGQPLPPPSEFEPTVVHEIRTTDGTVLMRGELPYQGIIRSRQLRALDFTFPETDLAAGTSWSRDVQEIQADGLPLCRWQWTCNAVSEKTATVKFTFEERQTSGPIKAEGTFVFDRSNGWPVSLDATEHNTTVPGDTENIVVNLHVVWRKL